MNVLKRMLNLSMTIGLSLAVVGCQKQPAAPAAHMQAMPVQTATIALTPVQQGSEYVGTIKSRNSATLQPQVTGRLTEIRAHSGEYVKAGQVLMEIDAAPQIAQVQAQTATEQQKKALYDYDTIELSRQKKLFDQGVTSRDALDQAQQAYANSKADYESAVALRKTDQSQLAYYTIRAPFDGIVGDIPVHVGDYVSTTTMLTTVDQGRNLEAYIYVPTDRSSQIHMGLPVELYDTSGKLLEKTAIDFISPQVDPTLQGILVKAPVHLAPEVVRNAQIINARVIWSSKPVPVIPVLAVVRLGGQTFVFVVRKQNGMTVAVEVPVTLGEAVGSSYAVTAGLNVGDQVIISSTQFLVSGMPVHPL
jgi:RND family efflux transporter MFP subunit